MTGDALREFDAAVEAAQLLGRTEARKERGEFTEQDSRFMLSMRRQIAKNRAALAAADAAPAVAGGDAVLPEGHPQAPMPQGWATLAVPCGAGRDFVHGPDPAIEACRVALLRAATPAPAVEREACQECAGYEAEGVFCPACGTDWNEATPPAEAREPSAGGAVEVQNAPQIIPEIITPTAPEPAAQGVDMVPVPRVPTEAMVRAFRADRGAPTHFTHTTLQCGDFDSRYRAMLAAAQARGDGMGERQENTDANR